MNNFQAVGDYIDQVILGQKGVPSCDIMVKKEHQLLYRHTSGVSNLETKTPISPDARYFLYSCTKPVTVAVAMRLVEQGLLELDAPVAQYLPVFSQLTVKDGEVLRPARTPLTVRHLFTMTGGFDYTLRGEPAVDAMLARQGEAATTLDVVNAFAQRPLHFEPGTHFRYSLCHDILAAVAEQIVGKPFHTYVQEVLFDPLGMTRSTFRCNDEILGSIADQYTFERGIMEPMEKNNEFLFTPNYDSGGAGLISCVEDYSRFADLMACGGTGANGYQLLRPETVRMLAEVQVPNAMVQEYDYSIGCLSLIHI